MSARNKVMELIKRKQRSNKAYHLKSMKRSGVDQTVLQFIQDYEVAKSEAKSAVDFDIALKRCLGFLESRLKTVDPNVHIKIHWFEEEKAKTWQDLQIEGVTVTWSAFYMGQNPLADKSRYVDVSSFFIEGL